MYIIPTPKSFQTTSGKFNLNRELNVKNNEFSENLIETLKKDLKLKDIKLNNETSCIDIEFIYNKKLKKEEYLVVVNPNKITLTASTDVGIFYGIKTLKQCVENKSIICCEIKDYPDLEIRGAMIDISRSKVPTLKTLKEITQMLADLKYNHLELYVEGFSYEYQSFKDVLVEKNYITLNDYLELEAFTEKNYIDLVPNQNGFGHMNAWLMKKEYHELAECPDGFTIWGSHRSSSTLDPTNPKSFKLVKKMYDDMLPHFKSKYFNMNFDEPYELGHGKSKEACEKTSVADVYIDFLLPLYKVVKKYKKTPLMWGDVLIHHPEALNRLPKDLIFVDWGYNLNYDFESHGKMLREHDVKFMMAPGTSTWSTITSRYYDMVGSIKNSSEATKKYQGLGLLVTDWGDIGHLQYLPFSYPGFIYGAECAWSTPNEEIIKPYLDKLVGPISSNAILKLATYTTLEGEYRDYGSRLFSLILWAEHSQNQEDQIKYFLEKMKSNLIEDKNLKQLESMFNDVMKDIRSEDTLVKGEIENSINLLLTLVDIQRNLKKVIFNDEHNVFEKDILILNAFIKKHHELWSIRNVEAGFIPSSNRIKWLINILTAIDGRR